MPRTNFIHFKDDLLNEDEERRRNAQVLYIIYTILANIFLLCISFAILTQRLLLQSLIIVPITISFVLYTVRVCQLYLKQVSEKDKDWYHTS